MAEYKIDNQIDITKEICPMTFVKTKLKLETMSTGEVLEVTLREGEPLMFIGSKLKTLFGLRAEPRVADRSAIRALDRGAIHD